MSWLTKRFITKVSISDHCSCILKQLKTSTPITQEKLLWYKDTPLQPPPCSEWPNPFSCLGVSGPHDTYILLQGCYQTWWNEAVLGEGLNASIIASHVLNPGHQVKKGMLGLGYTDIHYQYSIVPRCLH